MKNLFQRFWKNVFPEGSTKITKPRTAPSEYYLLECWNQYAELPEIILPYVDRIKRKVDWEALGFVLEINRLGQIRKIKIANRYYSFIPVHPSHGIELEAIRTGKRLTQNPQHIKLLLEQGSKPDEFLHLPAELNTAFMAVGVLLA